MVIPMARQNFQNDIPWAAYRKHGDPLPLAPNWIVSDLERRGIPFPQRGLWTAKALNCLALHGVNLDFDYKLQGMSPTAAQQSMVDRVVSAIADAGPMPEDLDGPTALAEMVACKDLYQEEPANLAPYDYSKIKVLQSSLKPRDLKTMVPGFVQGILRRFDTMIEKSNSELSEQGSCRIKPYWDPRLKSSPSELKKLVVRLSQIGLVSFRKGIKETIGIFCVKKKTPQFNRLIIDARRANFAHRAPPTTRLATPRSFLDLQFPKTDDGPLAFGLEADVSDCFYNYVCEETASWFGIPLRLTAGEWRELGWPGGPIYDDEMKGFFVPEENQPLYPVFRGLCMGWAWALFFANEAVAFAVADRIERPLMEVRDRLPPPCLGTDAITGVYVDNISIMATNKQAVVEAKERIEQRFGVDGIPLTWSSAEPQEVLQTIGVVFDFRKGVAHPVQRRVWRTFLAGRELLRRRRVSVKHLEIWVGHVTAIFMLTPPLLSCFFHTYRFLKRSEGKRAEVWKEVRSEIKLVLGTLWLARSTLAFDPVRHVDVGDASMQAYAMMSTEASTSEIAEACKWRELWRFRPIPEEIKSVAKAGEREELIRLLEGLHADSEVTLGGQEVKPSSQFGAGLCTQYATWMMEASDPTSWLRTSSVASQLKVKQPRKTLVEVPALVCPLSDELCKAGRYTLLWRKKWRCPEGHITLKEARVALSSLRRTCRVVELHGRLKLTLTDNLSCLCSFEKGRASDYKLNELCRVAAAYAIPTGIRWRLRHVETKRNPADRDSRFLEEKFLAPRIRRVHDRGKRQTHETGDFVPEGGCRSSSEGGDPCRYDLWCSKLEGEERHQPSVRTKASALTVSMKLSDDLKKGALPKRMELGVINRRGQTSRPQTLEKVEARLHKPGISSSTGDQDRVRKRGFFLEIFSGSGKLTESVRHAGLAALEPMEIKSGVHFDLRRRSTQLTVIAWVKSGLIAAIHLGTPCTVFSRARHGIKHMERAREKERVGVELALFTSEIIQTCNRYGVKWSLENPRHSRLFEVPTLTPLLFNPKVHRVDLDFCRYGERYKKPTSIFTNIPEMQGLASKCNHRSHAVTLRGSEVIEIGGKRCSVPKTQAAGQYPVALTRQWAQVLTEYVRPHSSELVVSNAQWSNELKKNIPSRSLQSKQISTIAAFDQHVQRFEEQFGKPEKLIVFGQHSNAGAKRRQKKLCEVQRQKQCGYESTRN